MFIYLYLVYYYLVFGCFSSVCSLHSHSVSFVVVVYCCCVLKSHHDKNAHDFSFSPELHLALISIEKKHHRKMSIEAPQFLTIFNPQLEMSTKGLNLVQSFRTCVCVVLFTKCMFEFSFEFEFRKKNIAVCFGSLLDDYCPCALND